MAPPPDNPSTSTAVPPASLKSGGHVKGHHRRTSSLWVPPTRPTFSNPGDVIRQKAENGGEALKAMVPPFLHRFLWQRNESREPRIIVPNNEKDPPQRWEHPSLQFKTNRISTTKYSIFTFLPKNLFEQFHRAANLYFIFIVVLNMIIGAFGRYISMLPIAFVLFLTAVKDAFEDYRRYKSDSKINHQTCRVWDSSQGRYRKMEWKNILIGDFVHLSHDEIIPADILLLKSSSSSGTCYVETSNLDGESNLKQRQVARAMGKYHSLTCEEPFSPDNFTYRVVMEAPCTDVYRFEGHLKSADGQPPIAKELALLSKENILLRGCAVRNTDFVEGIVLYAGHDTKAMLNNSGPRYKRSSLEKQANWDIAWCVLILLALCVTGAVLSGVWLGSFDEPLKVPFLTWGAESDKPEQSKLKPAQEAFVNFWGYIIVLQVMIPISLYVSIEIIKLGQIYFLSQDVEMYYEPVDKRVQCRALNIPEELGQIQFVMSDKTGTLTENEMIFRRCSVAGRDFGGQSVAPVDAPRLPNGTPVPRALRHSKDRALESILSGVVKHADADSTIYAFFVALALCNTVVVNARPHEDTMDPFGDIIEEKSEEEEARKEEKEESARREKERQQGAYHNVQFAVEEEREESTPSEPDMIELSDFPSKDEKEARKGEESGKGEKEKEPKETKKKGILAVDSRPSLISLARFQRFKEFAPFRRSMDKRASTATLPEVPPPFSFYDSESPDELALVEAAKEYGMRLMRRHFDEVTLHTRATGQYIKYKVLHTLPFDADRKRMSVILQETSGKGRLLLLCKGADSTMLPIMSTDWSESDDGAAAIATAQEHLHDYAREGLRTLVVARRWLDEVDYKEWRTLHEEAELDPHHRENLLRESWRRIECELELLGVTAIEDRLQDGVAETIAALRRAGIHVWVLTGDKVETAVNIAYSSKLFSSESMHLLNLSASGIGVVSELLDLHLSRVNATDERTSEASFGLVLNAPSLEYCLTAGNITRFCALLSRCESVLCCRATPLQKASLVRLAKHNLKAKVLAIGDGANDVSMIQGADVGVGLSGQEGMQAVMASDFALARFRFLSRLLLVHGHWCYHRLALVILYFFYKNAMFVFCIFWYQIFNGFSSQVPIDPIYLMVYNFLFTSLPSLLYGIIEQDASAMILTDNPILYDHGRTAKKYKWYSFWINMVDAAWQSAVVYFIAHFAYFHAECDMWTFGVLLVTQLLFVNSLHLAFLVQYWTWHLLVSIVGSIAFFFVFALIYNLLVTPDWGVKDTPSLVAELAIIDPRFWLVVLLSVVIALLPRFIFCVVRNSLFPSRLIHAKIEERVKLRQKPNSSPTAPI